MHNEIRKNSRHVNVALRFEAAQQFLQGEEKVRKMAGKMSRKKKDPVGSNLRHGNHGCNFFATSNVKVVAGNERRHDDLLKTL